MMSEIVVKELREPQPGLMKPDAMLTRVIPHFIDHCNVDIFKESSGIKSDGTIVFGYDQRQRFTKSNWINPEDRNESEDKFFGSLDKFDKQKVIDNKSIRLDLQKSPANNKVNLQIKYDGVPYALVTVPTGYKFGKMKLKDILKESFKQQIRIELAIE